MISPIVNQIVSCYSTNKGETERNTSIKKQQDSSVLSVSGKCIVSWMLSSFLFVSDNLDGLKSLSTEKDLPAPNSIVNVKGSETESLLDHGIAMDFTAMVSLIFCPVHKMSILPFEVLKLDFLF